MSVTELEQVAQKDHGGSVLRDFQTQLDTFLDNLLSLGFLWLWLLEQTISRGPFWAQLFCDCDTVLSPSMYQQQGPQLQDILLITPNTSPPPPKKG